MAHRVSTGPFWLSSGGQMVCNKNKDRSQWGKPREGKHWPDRAQSQPGVYPSCCSVLCLTLWEGATGGSSQPLPCHCSPLSPYSWRSPS